MPLRVFAPILRIQAGLPSLSIEIAPLRHCFHHYRQLSASSRLIKENSRELTRHDKLITITMPVDGTQHDKDNEDS